MSAITDPAPTDNLSRGRVLMSVGYAWVVLGGLLAAVTSPLNLELGSWAAAYLVLVLGMAQVMFGYGRSHLGVTSTRPALDLLAWNLGNLGVVAGSLFRLPILGDVGGVVLFAVLVVELVRSIRNSHGGWAIGYRIILVLLAISIPIGLVISHLRAA